MSPHDDSVATDVLSMRGNGLGDRAYQHFDGIRNACVFELLLGTDEHVFAMLALQLRHLWSRHIYRDLTVDEWLFVRMYQHNGATRATLRKGDCLIEGTQRSAGAIDGNQQFFHPNRISDAVHAVLISRKRLRCQLYARA